MRLRYFTCLPSSCLLALAITTFFISYSTSSMQMANKHSPNLTNKLNSIQHQYDTERVQNFLWRKRSFVPQARNHLSLPVSNLFEIPQLSGSTWSSGKRSKKGKLNALIRISSQDNEIWQSDVGGIELGYLLPSAPTSSKSVEHLLALFGSIARRKKIDEIRKALKRRSKNRMLELGGEPIDILSLVPEQETVGRNKGDGKMKKKLSRTQKQDRSKSQSKIKDLTPSGSDFSETNNYFTSLRNIENTNQLSESANFLNQILTTSKTDQEFPDEPIINLDQNFLDSSKFDVPKLEISELEQPKLFSDSSKESYHLPNRAFSKTPSTYQSSLRKEKPDIFDSQDLSTFADRPSDFGTFVQLPSKDPKYHIASAGFHTLADPVVLTNMKTGQEPIGQRPTMTESSWENGHFENESKDCHNIATKTCFTNSDCSCHGFYVCSQGRCDIVSTKPGQPADEDVWHSEPVDFGFMDHDGGVKQQIGDQIWHDGAINFGPVGGDTDFKHQGAHHMWGNDQTGFDIIEQKKDKSFPANLDKL